MKTNVFKKIRMENISQGVSAKNVMSCHVTDVTKSVKCKPKSIVRESF